MNTTFNKFYRQLGLATSGLFVVALTLYGITLLCAFLGFSHSAASFGGVALSLAFVFIVLFSLFLVASVTAAVIRWLDRRKQSNGSSHF